MAKIYETKEDLRREELTQDIKNHKQQSTNDASLGFISLAAASASASVTIINARVTKALDATPIGKSEKFLSWLPTVAFAGLSLISLATSFIHKRSEKDAQRELNAIGSQEALKFPFLEDATYAPAKGMENLPQPSFIKKIEGERAQSQGQSEGRQV